ncbi:hypothetical protein WR25_23584 [Diploscapter pachys]|uniref:ABC transmembrane type-1 domain-containing protein n=1 Tax=Diploscapter pachys TaxID=2018661 RepID=A0A2A2L2L6_9BILA|nr:hypothetical protein WR25_23584 [Diploscapter pachys]
MTMKDGKNAPLEVTEPLLDRRKSSSSQLLPQQSKAMTTNYGLFHYSTGIDYLLVFFGFLASFIHGAGFPVLAIILGGMTTSFLRAQNSEFVVGEGNVDPNGLKPISQEEFNSEIGIYCLYYLALGVAMFVTSYVQIACWESFSERVTHKLRQNYLKAILRQQIEWFDNEQTGNLTARLTDDLERVREGLGDKLSLFIQMLSAFVAGYGIGFFYSWSMTVVMMLIAPFIVLVGAYLSKMMATRTRVEQETYAVAGAIAEETFSSIRTVHSLNGHKRELTRFESALENGRKIGIIKYVYMGVSVGFSNFCMYASYALAFWYGSTLVINDPSIDRGLIFTVFFAVMSGSTALGSALPHLGSISTAKGAAHTVLRVINNHPFIDPYSLDGVTLTDVKGAITLHNVHFTYPSRPTNPILKGVSIEVKAGHKIALVGASGCGKSTIINLLLRFYDPTKGKIYIDGVELKDMNVHNLRENIALVSQEPVLFDGTLYENIRMGNENATHEQVVEACELANAADFIKKLPDKYSTRVGERGIQLSGGQKQRIAIARALVKNPKILLLDEATSALDTEAEQIVQKALEQAQVGRTTIIVAHRLSTIRSADEIFVFKAGEIVEKGTHEELIARKGLFYDMTMAQSLQAREAIERELDEDSLSERLSMGGSIRSRKSSGSHRFSVQSLQKKISSVSSIHSMIKEAEEIQQSPSPLGKIISFNRENLGWFALGSIGSILFGSTTPIFALLYAQIFSVYSEPVEQMKGDVLFWCGMFLILGITYAFGFFIAAFGLGHAGEALTKKLRLESFRNLLRQDIGFYDDLKHGTGKLCTRFATDAPNVRYVFTRMPAVLSSVIAVAGALAIGFIFGWQLALILLLMVPLLIASGYFEFKMQYGRKMRDTELLEEAGKVASQAVEHIRTVQAFNRQQQFNFMYTEYLREPYK